MAKGFKKGVGGANPLNFKVVGGTTEPSNPRKNMVWVNTDQKITSWFFSETEPSEPEEGVVWFKTSASSPAAFNALKKNGIQVCPISVKQYISGAFVNKTVEIYQNGKWINTAMQIYKPNDYCGYTWTSKGCEPYSGSGQATKAPTQKVNSDGSLTFSVSGGSGMAYCTTQFDLTDFNTLVVEGAISNNGEHSNWYSSNRIAVYSKITNYSGSNIAASTGGIQSGIMKIDVSELTGKYYIGCTPWSDGTATITFKDIKLI